MKQSLRKYLYVAIVCLAGAHIYAYDTYDTDHHAVDARAFYNCNSVSAHVTDMFRYGEFQTSLFTGRLQVSVPIYKVDDPDFNMDIALHYNAEGFKPRKHSGYVGYNWFLEGGGCITREVKGLPDEIYGLEARPSGQSYDTTGIEGMYHFITQNPEAASIDRNDVFDIPDTPDSEACVTGNNLWHNVGSGCTYKVDYMPDIFHFDFLGYKGSFMINNAGEIQIISGDFVKVDLSGILADWDPDNPLRLLEQSYPMYPKENSTITIQTTDGYTYVFGGDYSKLEYTVNVHGRREFLPDPPQYDPGEYNPPTVSTWYLAEIIAPNKRTMTYYYKPAQKPDQYDLLYETLDSLQNAQACSIPGTNDPLWEFNECFDRFGKYFQDMAVLHDNIINNNILYGPYPDEEYQCLLAFYNPPYIHAGGSFYLYSATKTCILDSILISGEQPLKIIFHNSQEDTPMYDEEHYWSYNNSNSKRNFQLDSVCIFSSNNAIKTAAMTYIDNGYHYGNTVSNWRFLSSVHVSGVGKYQMTYNSGTYPNLFDLAYTHAGIYHVPTGESDETDDYGYYVSSNYSMALLQKLEYPTGGYQTYSYQQYSYNKKRKYTVADSNVEMNTVNESGNKRGARIHEVKTFDKLNHLVESKKYTYADGIFYDNLRVYNLAEDLYPQYGWPVRYNANYGLLDTHIGYGKVTEEVTDTYGAKYKTIYQFDLGENSYTSQNDVNANDKYYCENRKFGVLEGHQLYSSNLRKWGKLMSINNYDSNNDLQRSICYEYNNSQMCTDTIVVFNCGYGYSLAKKLYVYPDVMTRQVSYDYSQGDSLTITKSYTYDRKLRVKKELVRDSRDILHFTRYSYPDDISGANSISGTPSPLFLMIHSNRIGTPVESLSGYISNGTEFVTSGTIDLYANHTFPVNNNLYFRTYLYQTLSLALSEPIARANYQSISMSNGQVSYDSHYKLDCEYDFDIMYRPLSIKPFGQWATTYTWNGIYPASKTVGNQTWTYTHIPHVGVSSITDPRGITTYYSYDRYGRLTEEYQLLNGNKQVLNAYHYHIKTE